MGSGCDCEKLNPLTAAAADDTSNTHQDIAFKINWEYTSGTQAWQLNNLAVAAPSRTSSQAADTGRNHLQNIFKPPRC